MRRDVAAPHPLTSISNGVGVFSGSGCVASAAGSACEHARAHAVPRRA